MSTASADVEGLNGRSGAAESQGSTETSVQRRLSPVALGLVATVICPHCWHRFPPQDLLWITEHGDLLGDAVLGPESQSRFRPSRFTPDGAALDARGMRCQRFACPRCHLSVVQPLLEIPPLFISVIGVPASGKSYLLATMVWKMRHQLPQRFGLTFADADPGGNQLLNSNEETLFLQDDPDKPVALRKTELQGELYDEVRLGEHIMILPRPFLFTVRPNRSHPNQGKPRGQRSDRVICLYDNAGEHFQPGADNSASPVTQHLGEARVLLFLYDPTQDPRFRALARAANGDQPARPLDPQLGSSGRAQRQETTVHEAAERVRRQLGLPQGRRHNRPLVVVVSKLDVWETLLPDEARQLLADEPLAAGVVSGHGCKLDAVQTQKIEMVSGHVRDLLLTHTPEFVAATEAFCEHVIYVPVSALGCSPHKDENTGLLAVRPSEIRPRWVTVPLLYAFAKWTSGLIAGTKHK